MAYGNKLTRFMYYSSFPILRNAIATFYGFKSSFSKYGPYYKRYLEELERSQWFATEQLEELQLRRLKELLNYTFDYVPYYRELSRQLGISADEIETIDDLRKLPILDKETVRQNEERLISEEFVKEELVHVHTSGTTGKTLDIYLTKECFQKEYAFTWLHRSWAGVDYRDRTATLAGHPVIPIEQEDPPFWVKNFYENQIIFSSYHINKGNLKYYVKALEDFQPELIHGYPSSIYLIALYIKDNNIRSIRPKAVFAASETLLDHQRQEIEEAFGCKVFMWYGNTEMVANIVECKNGNYHVKHEHSVVEFLNKDNEPAEPGEEGRMVCTGLGNYAMPLIRYDVGDMAIPSDKDSCSCGRGGMLVERLIGRVENYVVTPDGRYIGRLDHVFKDAQNVVEAQIIQESIDAITLKIVKAPKFNSKDEKKIIANTRERVGHKIQVNLEYVEHIPRTSSGKFCFIISKVPLEKRLEVR